MSRVLEEASSGLKGNYVIAIVATAILTGSFHLFSLNL